MSSDGAVHSKVIVWKHGHVGGEISDDEKMRRVVDTIKNDDNELFLHWIELSEDVNVRDSCGNTALHWAASLGSLPAVTHLIIAGAKVNALNCNGATPLHCAAICGYVNIIEQLLRNGADAAAVNKNGQTMFDLLRIMGWEGASIMLERLEAALLGPGNGGKITVDVSFSDAPLLGSLPAPLLPGTGDSEGNETALQSPLQIKEKTRHYADINVIDPSDAEELLYMQRSAEIELLVSSEMAGRNEVIIEYVRWMLSIRDTMMPENVVRVEKRSGEVEVVFGEKYSPYGPHQLLVRMVGDAEGEEFWVDAEEVADCVAVKTYVDRHNQTINNQSNSLNFIGFGGFYSRDPLENAERQELSRELNKLLHGNSHVLSSASESNAPKALSTQIPPLCVSSSVKLVPRQPVNERKQTASLNSSLYKVVVSRSSHDSSRGIPSHGSAASTLAYQCSSMTTVATHCSSMTTVATHCSSDEHDEHTNRGSLSTLPNKLDYVVAASVGKEPTVVPHAMPSENKPPYIRQYLSEEEKRKYEAFLRVSALRHLERKRWRQKISYY
ncbi:LmrCD-specific DARPin [Trypanosoma rangeli]|uniref:LmrCD-specific DARPin n=1 Tax=Trypanosoma rangeli TaxID=5698 RepID=A0A422P1E9_TRYRA|nr:LmrCD-specific DARPin [Trypanosoma rangeli]RNF11527.1 LmrCD-specific DARPin [Trypanosoma rangeli]|eukprot:RNF11527.1 LmrCD-specific DARPin [Trypanosoma rangeli]